MKKLVYLILFCWATIGFCQNQNPTITKLNTIELDADEFLGYDSLGYVYYIKNNVLSKKKEAEYYNYSNIALGKISRVDLQNPLKLVLFYEDFNTIVTVDNQLNETQKINFSENTFPIVATATGLAAQNQLWVFDSNTQQLGLFDYLKNTSKTLAVPFVDRIKFFSSDFNTFYWLDTKNNWFSCDLFGAVTSIGIIPDYDYLALINSYQYIYTKDGKVIFTDLKKQQNAPLEISEKTFVKIYYKDQILSIFTTSGISNYKIIIP